MVVCVLVLVAYFLSLHFGLGRPCFGKTLPRLLSGLCLLSHLRISQRLCPYHLLKHCHPPPQCFADITIVAPSMAQGHVSGFIKLYLKANNDRKRKALHQPKQIQIFAHGRLPCIERLPCKAVYKIHIVLWWLAQFTPFPGSVYSLCVCHGFGRFVIGIFLFFLPQKYKHFTTIYLNLPQFSF